MHTDAPPPLTTSITDRVKQIMRRGGILSTKQLQELATVLDLSVTDAKKVMERHDDDAWKVSELRKLAGHFGVSINDITTRANEDYDIEEVILEFAGRRLSCVGWIGSIALSAAGHDFVAIKRQDGWQVYEGSLAPKSDRYYQVHKLEIAPARPPSPTVAIVDDSRICADNVRDYLRAVGYTATSFYEPEDFMEALGQQTFDVYLLDWFLGSGTAKPLIEAIRESIAPRAPIMLVTGAMEESANSSHEPDLAAIVAKFDVVMLSKPIASRLIAAEISRVL